MAKEGRKITGVSLAFVNVAEGKPPVEFYEGDVLPADLPQAELDRLDALNVFGVHPRVEAARRQALLAEAGLPAGQPLRSDEERHALVDRARTAADDDGDVTGDPLMELSAKNLHDLIASRPDIPTQPAKAAKKDLVAAIHAADDAGMARTANPGVDPTVGHGGDGRNPVDVPE